MDLIKKLGGYEKAKVILQAVGHEHDAMLLEYRREHNIFEAGDKVLRNDIEQNAIFTIVEKSTLNDREIIYCSINDVDYCFYSDILRHVTDKEIKVGHRL